MLKEEVDAEDIAEVVAFQQMDLDMPDEALRGEPGGKPSRRRAASASPSRGIPLRR